MTSAIDSRLLATLCFDLLILCTALAVFTMAKNERGGWIPCTAKSGDMSWLLAGVVVQVLLVIVPLLVIVKLMGPDPHRSPVALLAGFALVMATCVPINLAARAVGINRAVVSWLRLDGDQTLTVRTLEGESTRIDLSRAKPQLSLVATEIQDQGQPQGQGVQFVQCDLVQDNQCFSFILNAYSRLASKQSKGPFPAPKGLYVQSHQKELRALFESLAPLELRA